MGNAGGSPQDLAALGALQDSFLPRTAAQGGGPHESERTRWLVMVCTRSMSVRHAIQLGF